jgi:hypothetical protein
MAYYFLPFHTPTIILTSLIVSWLGKHALGKPLDHILKMTTGLTVSDEGL